MDLESEYVCLTCLIGGDDTHTEHDMVRFTVEKAPVVVHDITEASDDEIKGFLMRAFGEPA